MTNAKVNANEFTVLEVDIAKTRILKLAQVDVTILKYAVSKGVVTERGSGKVTIEEVAAIVFCIKDYLVCVILVFICLIFKDSAVHVPVGSMGEFSHWPNGRQWV